MTLKTLTKNQKLLNIYEKIGLSNYHQYPDFGHYDFRFWGVQNFCPFEIRNRKTKRLYLTYFRQKSLPADVALQTCNYFLFDNYFRIIEF